MITKTMVQTDHPSVCGLVTIGSSIDRNVACSLSVRSSTAGAKHRDGLAHHGTLLPTRAEKDAPHFVVTGGHTAVPEHTGPRCAVAIELEAPPSNARILITTSCWFLRCATHVPGHDVGMRQVAAFATVSDGLRMRGTRFLVASSCVRGRDVGNFPRLSGKSALLTWRAVMGLASAAEEGMPETTPVTSLFDLAALELLHARYLSKDPEGRIVETPEDMFRRVARHVAAVEERFGGDSRQWADRFEHAMSALEFLPNSPMLMNAGTPVGQLAACFVLPVEDHLESIFATMRDAALVHRSGGGVGFDFSRLRPAGDPLASTGGVSSGPVSFMHVFDAASEAVRSGGRRRAANMGAMDVHHPDIEAFISAKRDSPGLRTFNLSVACDDAFMQAATGATDIPLVNPHTGKTVAMRSAAGLFDRIVECAWATGDPGLLFLDRINQDNPTPALGRITVTNPCGEVPLLPNEACFLGSINLARLTRGSHLDWERLGELVELAVRFLDDGIDASRFPIAAIAQAVVRTRKIGVGVMGFADCLVDLGIPYDSQRALELATKIMTAVDEHATNASRQLARERSPFPAFADSRDAMAHRPAIRNATRTAIAPTGSLALLAGCSHSIEPYYALAYSRRMLDERTFRVLNPRLVREAEALGAWNPALQQHVLTTGTVRDDPSLPARLRTMFPTALDIDPDWHVRMQAAFQQRVDNGVSKTINLPESAQRDAIRRAFHLAWTLGCKGITVYRQGTRTGQVLGPVEAEVAQCPECASGPAAPISPA